MGIEEVESGSSPEPSLSSENNSLTSGTMTTDIKELIMLKGLDDWAAELLLNDSITQTRRIRQKLKTSMTKKSDEDTKRRPMVI